MWRGYEEALVCYGVSICRAWTDRGYADTCLNTLVTEYGALPRSQSALRRAGALPAWLGSPALHRSHRSALLRKDPAHYGPLFGTIATDLDYVWPVTAAPAPAAAP